MNSITEFSSPVQSIRQCVGCIADFDGHWSSDAFNARIKLQVEFVKTALSRSEHIIVRTQHSDASGHLSQFKLTL